VRFHSIILSTFEAVFLLREVVAFTSHLSPEAGKDFDSHCEGFLGARLSSGKPSVSPGSISEENQHPINFNRLLLRCFWNNNVDAMESRSFIE